MPTYYSLQKHIMTVQIIVSIADIFIMNNGTMIYHGQTHKNQRIP